MAPTKRKKIVKTHHWWFVGIMIAGFLLPPIAVLMRFGVCRDFFINIIMTLLGYFPGHGHNFYLQNIRNNKGRNRSPKWAVKYGLVEDYKKVLKGKREWANRYDQNNATNAYDDPSHETHDEWGNRIVDIDEDGNRIADPTHLSSNIQAVKDDYRETHGHGHGGSEERMPNSARGLERYDSRDSDNASFYGDQDATVGSAPGSDHARGTKRYKQGRQEGFRHMVTGTATGSSKKADRHAKMDQERARTADVYDRQREVDDGLDHTF